MATPATYRIFLSAVTRELGSFRRDVARVLRRKGLEVREQEHFRQGPATLLERLRSYIEQCDAVILLIGDRYGAFPTDKHAAALGVVAPFETYRANTGQDGASTGPPLGACYAFSRPHGGCEMTRVEALEGEIQKLTGTEFVQLRDWLLEEDWDRWDQQIQKDAASGKLEDLFAQLPPETQALARAN